MDPSTPAAAEHFTIGQKLTMMVNRYEIRHADAAWREGGVVGVAQQKRMSFREQVTFYSDDQRTVPVFSFKARTRMDLGATYDVFDAAGTPVGWFRKDFGKSLLRSTWHLGTADGLEAVGSERNTNIAVIRRIWEFLPVIGDIPVPFIFHFDFVAPDGSVVLTSERRRSIRDRYQVSVPRQPNGWQLDWRVAMSMAVALDALQSR